MDAKIYGHNHSPWVQAVLLGFHEKKIKYTLYQTPPFEILKIWGQLNSFYICFKAKGQEYG